MNDGHFARFEALGERHNTGTTKTTHYPINGNRMLKAICGATGLIRKATDPKLVTCDECRDRMGSAEGE